jgi:hypothetical protein
MGTEQVTYQTLLFLDRALFKSSLIFFQSENQILLAISLLSFDDYCFILLSVELFKIPGVSATSESNTQIALCPFLPVWQMPGLTVKFVPQSESLGAMEVAGRLSVLYRPLGHEDFVSSSL